MSSTSSWSARCLFSALLLVSLVAVPSSAQSNTSMEVDLISPVPNGRYRVNPDRGFAVLVAIQNREHGDPAGWRFEWHAIRRDPARPRFFTSGTVSSSGTNIYGAVTHPLNHTASDPYLALSHPYIEANTDKPINHPTPPGEYEFTWNFQIGPWCEVLTAPRSREYASNHFISRGAFNFTVAEDAPWPVLTRTAADQACASVAGQVSFTAYNTMAPMWNTMLDWTMGPCAMTASVTDAPAPCRATVDAEQAARVSSIM
ncbi:hypothetical protein QBC39DRAFT_292880, partial [Podospora conica]